MSTSHLNSMAELPGIDPASLEGLEPLLDRVFNFDPDAALEMTEIKPLRIAPVQEVEEEEYGLELFSSDAPDIISAGGRYSPSGESLLVGELKATIDLLRAQLDYAATELKESNNRVRWLETQMAAKEDQLALLPDLLSRAGQLTVAEKEMAVLRQDADELKARTAEMNELCAEFRSGLEELIKDIEQANRPWWQKLFDLFRWITG